MFCVDCRHHFYAHDLSKPAHRCQHPALVEIDMVTGARLSRSCYEMKRTECTDPNDALYFEEIEEV